MRGVTFFYARCLAVLPTGAFAGRGCPARRTSGAYCICLTSRLALAVIDSGDPASWRWRGPDFYAQIVPYTDRLDRQPGKESSPPAIMLREGSCFALCGARRLLGRSAASRGYPRSLCGWPFGSLGQPFQVHSRLHRVRTLGLLMPQIRWSDGSQPLRPWRPLS